MRLVVALVLLAVGEAGWTCWRIVRQSTVDELRPASAIVVFGAAEYSGRPSPVYRARLDHAFDLYARHLAPWVITTGGAGGDPSYSEGGVGAEGVVDVIEGGIAHGKVGGQPASMKSGGLGDRKLRRSLVRGWAKPSFQAWSIWRG